MNIILTLVITTGHLVIKTPQMAKRTQPSELISLNVVTFFIINEMSSTIEAE